MVVTPHYQKTVAKFLILTIETQKNTLGEISKPHRKLDYLRSQYS